MIMILMALFAILTFVAWLVVPVRKWQMILGVIATLGLITTVAAMTLNFTHQLGMRQVETVKTTEIYSAGSPWMNPKMMIAEPLGTDKEHYIMVYRDEVSDTEPTAHFKPDQEKLAEATKSHATYKQDKRYKTAQVEIKTTRLEWENGLVKWLFGTSGQDKQIVKEEAEVHVPADWVVMTQAEAQKMMAAKQ